MMALLCIVVVSVSASFFFMTMAVFAPSATNALLRALVSRIRK